ncbi:MAG: archaetidylserine decarboxylase [Lentisphaerales bacterium]|nr:archaetidylserine decarboxylase [Lentisphaerales bacterium]
MKSLHLLFLHLLPKNLVSRVIGALASRSISKIAVKWFAKRYKINLEEAQEPIGSFKTLNDFFTRKLKDGARPIEDSENPKAIVSPVDGKIAQFGPIENGGIIQAKGREYTVQELLGDDKEAEPFINGTFMTIYLAPTDYHRMHHYMDGEVTGFRYIPGTLFPVNPFSVANIENLFPINERLTTYYDCAGKSAAIVKVGATVVGKIKVTYSDAESNISRNVRAETFSEKIPVKKGDELGLFAMGSTVVMLFPEGSAEFIDNLPTDEKVRVGQKLGHWN